MKDSADIQLKTDGERLERARQDAKKANDELAKNKRKLELQTAKVASL